MNRTGYRQFEKAVNRTGSPSWAIIELSYHFRTAIANNCSTNSLSSDGGGVPESKDSSWAFFFPMSSGSRLQCQRLSSSRISVPCGKSSDGAGRVIKKRKVWLFEASRVSEKEIM
jgi:hypothetical protein